MLEAESSSSDSSSDADSSSEDSSSDSDSESDASDDSRDPRSYRRSSTPPRQYRRDSPRRGQGDVGRHLHRPVTAGTRHGADAMIAGPRRHLTLAETTIGALVVEVVTGVFVASYHPPPGGIVGAATRSRGRLLASLSVTNVIVSVLRHGERAHGTGAGTVLVITTAEEMIQGTDTRIPGVDEDVYSFKLGVSTCRVRVVFFCLICLSPYS